ncbi:MAG: tetratricopeptide repeat protein, partial [Candidatus Caenarcaniphilales bacterium]|nr:tetratricopeptide repeat protein [Candidatus Caenarcaniphilales bacterium]
MRLSKKTFILKTSISLLICIALSAKAQVMMPSTTSIANQGASTLSIPGRQYGIPLQDAPNTGQNIKGNPAIIQNSQPQIIQTAGPLEGNVIYNPSSGATQGQILQNTNPAFSQSQNQQWNTQENNGYGQNLIPANPLPTADPDKLEFSKLTQTTPSDSKGYFERGLTKYRLRDYTGALEDFNKAIGIDPYYAKAYYNRGVVML